MIMITKFGAQKVIDYLKEKNLSNDYYLRASVKGGGCSGFTFELNFDDKPLNEDDLEFVSNNIKIVTKEICLTYLDGTEIDYIEKLIGGGFTFKNPNATGYCGCGKSFAT